MSLDLERHLIFYGAYHHNAVNLRLHMVFVPIILFTFFAYSANSGVLVPLPSWLTVPYLPFNLCTIFALLWGGLYVLLEPVAGTALGLICLGVAALNNYLFAADPVSLTQWAIGLHLLSWIAQFIGHGTFERRRPALMDNLLQAWFLAPLFVWLEVLFALGYRRELQQRVEKAVESEFRKLNSSEVPKKNGKTQ